MRRFRVESATGKYIDIEIVDEYRDILKARVVGEDREYTIRILRFDEELKQAIIEINGNIIKVTGVSRGIMIDGIPSIVKRVIEYIPVGISREDFSKRKTPLPIEKGIITAPISGKIIDVKVKPGDHVTSDSIVALMESMKMVTEIKAGVEGVVEEVYVEKGKAVNKGEKLVKIKLAEELKKTKRRK